MIEKISLTDPVAHAHDRELRKWAMEKALYSMALGHFFSVHLSVPVLSFV